MPAEEQLTLGGYTDPGYQTGGYKPPPEADVRPDPYAGTGGYKPPTETTVRDDPYAGTGGLRDPQTENKEEELTLGGYSYGSETPDPYTTTNPEVNETNIKPDAEQTAAPSGDGGSYVGDGELTLGGYTDPNYVPPAGGTTTTAGVAGSDPDALNGNLGTTPTGGTEGGDTSPTGGPAPGGTAVTGGGTPPAGGTATTTGTENVTQLPTSGGTDSGQVLTPEQIATTYPLLSGILDGSGTYISLDPQQQVRALDQLNVALSRGEVQWNNVIGPAVREGYIAKFGDPAQNTSGPTDNSQDPDGSVQGQYDVPSGGAYQAESTDATASTATASTIADQGEMSVEEAQAAFIAENGREMTPEEMASFQMNQILSQDSPLMMLAQQQGIDLSQSQGLRNSSLAAGNSMAAMAEKATPLALQQADAYGAMAGQNQLVTQQQLELNAAMEQEAALANAAAQNDATSQEYQTGADIDATNAGMETDVSLANAGMETDVSVGNANNATDTAVSNADMANQMQITDRANELTMELQQLVGDQDYAKQELASQFAFAMAQLENDYKQIISTNDTAGRVMLGLQEGIAEILSNDKLKAAEADAKVQQLIDAAYDSLDIIGAVNGVDLSGLVNGDTSSGSGLGDEWTQGPNGEWLYNGEAFNAGNFDIGNLP